MNYDSVSTLCNTLRYFFSENLNYITVDNRDYGNTYTIAFEASEFDDFEGDVALNVHITNTDVLSVSLFYTETNTSELLINDFQAVRTLGAPNCEVQKLIELLENKVNFMNANAEINTFISKFNSSEEDE